MKVVEVMTNINRSEGRWMPKIDGVLLICWRQTARKHGSIQERNKACMNGIFIVGRNVKGRW